MYLSSASYSSAMTLWSRICVSSPSVFGLDATAWSYSIVRFSFFSVSHNWKVPKEASNITLPCLSVSGHEKLPIGGQINAHTRPTKLPTDGQQ